MMVARLSNDKGCSDLSSGKNKAWELQACWHIRHLVTLAFYKLLFTPHDMIGAHKMPIVFGCDTL